MSGPLFRGGHSLLKALCLVGFGSIAPHRTAPQSFRGEPVCAPSTRVARGRCQYHPPEPSWDPVGMRCWLFSFLCVALTGGRSRSRFSECYRIAVVCFYLFSCLRLPTHSVCVCDDNVWALGHAGCDSLPPPSLPPSYPPTLWVPTRAHPPFPPGPPQGDLPGNPPVYPPGTPPGHTRRHPESQEGETRKATQPGVGSRTSTQPAGGTRKSTQPRGRNTKIPPDRGGGTRKSTQPIPPHDLEKWRIRKEG